MACTWRQRDKNNENVYSSYCWILYLLVFSPNNCFFQVICVVEEFSLLYNNFHAFFPVYASSMINPIIYAAMSRSFRKEFLKIVRNS